MNRQQEKFRTTLKQDPKNRVKMETRKDECAKKRVEPLLSKLWFHY